ncbi:MAG TPA: TetR/AcrR family transcriptional regulator [Lachnospiraceae bacterium]|nr:TetR/AcrR family transcriptional regulator [Lachnospiraceae bacterium]
MARKEQVTKQVILKGAFELLREQGIESVTARKLASHIGCSTQPIFRVYENMESLRADLFNLSRDYYDNYCLNHKKESAVPFVDLGLCYIGFAKEELNLFKLLFLSPHDEDNTMYDLINGKENGFVIKELKRVHNLRMDRAQLLFMKIFIFIHGMACMATSGEFDLSRDEAVQLLTEIIESFTKNQ